MRMSAALVVMVPLLALSPRPVPAKEVGGVSFPATVQASGKTLVLNGAGLRTRFFVKVYAMGLYLEQPSTDARAILAADQVRRAELRMLRGVSGSDMADAIGQAFAANAGAAAGSLQTRLDRLKAMFPNAQTGEVITLTYLPGTGTVVGAQGGDLGTIEGKDFADVLFSAWIGAYPVDGSLKQALLAGRT